MGRKERAKLGQDLYRQRHNDRGNSPGFMNYPSGINFYKADVGEHNILIIPYQIKTENHPLVVRGIKKVGEWDYALTLEVHRRIGPENLDIICLKKNFNKDCPLCNEGGDLEKTSKRAVYNIINVERLRKGLYIFQTSAFLFDKELQEELKAKSKGEEIIPFADPEDGRIVKFRGSTRKTDSGSFIEFKSFEFLKREDDVDEAYEEERWEEKSLSLDKYMNIYSYEEIENVLYGRDIKKDDNSNDEDEQDEDDEKEDRRERRRKRNEEKEEEVEKDTCPHGYKFGKDTDESDECNKCDVWDACDKKERENRKKKKNK